MKKFNILLANLLFLFHCLIGIVILIGWMFPKLKIVYLALLIFWISSWIFLGYCPITKWEFTLRRKYDKNINTDAEAIKYYLYKFFKKDVASKVIFIWGLAAFIILVILTLFIH